MSDIGSARSRLLHVAEEIESKGLVAEATDIRAVVEECMYRRAPARRMPRKSAAVTPRLKKRVLKLADTTSLHNAEIAVKLNLNPGRVSEILQGDR
uniref:hypothetical protein n=1 Tax=uncultured Caulobacter sp. TaxID=158749 RepID=UPI0025D30BAE|nr:hypothetical protein [uncultured Caulobacter sp.]